MHASGRMLETKTTLWMAELDDWMDEGFLTAVFFQYGQVVEAKMVRDKVTGKHAGYAFVDFDSHKTAASILDVVNGTLIPGTSRVFKLNWSASHGLNDGGWRPPEFPIFIGDLDPDVTEEMLSQLFFARYRSIKHIGIAKDPMTGVARGYGFVRFLDENEARAAIRDVNGVWLGSKQILVSTATPRPRIAGDHSMHPGSMPLLVAPQPKPKRPRFAANQGVSLLSRGPKEGFSLLNPLRFGSMFQYHIQPQDPLGGVSVENMNSEYCAQMDAFADRLLTNAL